MIKRTWIISIAVLTLAALAAVSVALAWFFTGVSYNNIVVRSGVVEGEAYLYYYEDFDHDGTLDKVDGEYVSTPIATSNISKIKAGDVYFYRVDILNTGSVICDLNVYFDGIPQKAKEVLTVESYVIDGNGGEISGAGTSGNRVSLTVADNFAAVAGLIGTKDMQDPPDKQVSVFFKLRFERLENLKTILPATFADAENLNDYQNIPLSDMKIVVNFTQHTE